MKKLSFIVSSLLLVTACFPDQRNNFMVPDSFGIASEGNVTEASVHTGSFKVGLIKSGLGQSAAGLRIQRDPAAVAKALAAYNEENKTAFKALPDNLVSMDATRLYFTEKEVSKQVTVSWNPEATAAKMGESEQFVIPVLLESEDEKAVKIAKGRGLLLIHMNRSSVGIKQEDISREIAKKDLFPGGGLQPQLQESFTFDVEISKSIKNVGLHYPVKLDNSLIAAYNAEKGTSYVAAPEGLVTIQGDGVGIPEGGVSGNFSVTLDYSVLTSGETLPQFPDYLVPIALDIPGMSATQSGKPFRLEGLSYSREVVYISVTWKPTVVGLGIERAWGKYSTATAAWNAYFGGTAGSDRNLAMDDDNIYLAEFTPGVKKLWAINLRTPGNVSSLPVGTVLNEGFADMYLTCPRVLKNNDPGLNGGKDVLVVSNLATGNFLRMYFYFDGIGQDPKRVEFRIYQERRLGDTWNFWGSIQEGMFYMKDFNDKTALVTFKQTHDYPSENPYNPLQGRFVMAEHTGAGSYWPYPEDKNKGIYTIRDDFNARATAFLNDSWTATGGNDGNSFTDLGANYNNSCFQFFEYKGKRYVACATQPAVDDGRLFILEGALTDSWESIIQTRNIIYHAAIQNSYEGPEDGEISPSPMESTHSGLDICARLVGDDVYIAVVKQKVGLSLFHMTYTDAE